MTNIHIMTEKLANMIAAGEVVDRPSSVVKELVENAIDAGASKIIIEIKQFGLELIKVTDNGSGMSLEDAKLAFLRHATSKISKEEDLSKIKTLGFRGEALAAISSVSNVTIVTKTSDSDGYKLLFEASKLIHQEKNAANVGTSISVSNLFYNVPARFKYIKSEFAEKQHILDLFDRLSLANPNIKMTLIYDGKQLKETYGNNHIPDTLAHIYGPSILQDLEIIDDHFQKIHIRLFLCSPSINKSKKKDIHIFINGRNIKNYMLQQSIIEGYHTLLMVNRFPVALLYLTIDPKLIDVNVHPQKYEVKMQNEQLLAFHIKSLILNAFKMQKQSIFSKVDEVIPGYNKEKETYKSINIFEETIANNGLFIEEAPVFETKLPVFDYIGQLAGTYLLFQNEEGLFLVDQHAAQERIRYEYYYQKLTNPIFESKNRLIAYSLSLTSSQKELINQYQDQIHSLGFDFNEDFAIIKEPVWLLESELDKAIDIILSSLEEKGKVSLADLRDQLAKDISCKGAIKANHKLNLHEVNQLMIDLNKCDNPYSCPHGRPVTIKVTFHDIERMFKRIV